MSNKRPLSPATSNESINDTKIRSLKRLKLHSIIQELRNEETNLVLLKKLRSCQQLATRTNNSVATTNGFHSNVARVSINKSATSIPSISDLSSRQSLQQPLQPTTQKLSNPVNPSVPTKIPAPLPTKNSIPSSATTYSFEERKTQAKKALRNQLERDLLNIPSPKPLLRDILFIPNPNSLEFQPYIGLEDVVQCLYELQTDRQRLPQRFTDRAQIDEPYVCDHCGTDFTIRWWKHFNNNQQTNILCDRCKKQVIRRTLKSEHSTLLKNVFVSAMEKEKEIEKTFQTLIKQQQKNVSRSTSSSLSSSTSKPIINNRPVPSPVTAQMQQSIAPIPTYNNNKHHSHPHHPHSHSHHHQQQQQKAKPKTALPQTQNFATKVSQQSTSLTSATRKSNSIAQPTIMNPTNNIRTLSQNKTPMPVYQQQQQQQQQQQFRPGTSLPQQMKHNQIAKVPKTAPRQQAVVSSRPIHPPTGAINPPSIFHSSLTSANIRPTATKRRTLPTVNMK